MLTELIKSMLDQAGPTEPGGHCSHGMSWRRNPNHGEIDMTARTVRPGPRKITAKAQLVHK
jgi:hypothetical protein